MTDKILVPDIATLGNYPHGTVFKDSDGAFGLIERDPGDVQPITYASVFGWYDAVQLSAFAYPVEIIREGPEATKEKP